jgi:hypothetical protein
MNTNADRQRLFLFIFVEWTRGIKVAKRPEIEFQTEDPYFVPTRQGRSGTVSLFTSSQL